jgi:hypothetical protein
MVARDIPHSLLVDSKGKHRDAPTIELWRIEQDCDLSLIVGFYALIKGAIGMI